MSDQPQRITLSPAELIVLQNQNLKNALSKLESGLTLSKNEWEIIHSATEKEPTPSALPENQENRPENPENRADFTLHGEEWDKVTIARHYEIETRTVERCLAVGRLPDVDQPPPFEDPRALAEWYRRHYRSDLTKPAKTKKKLPVWIEAALRKPYPKQSRGAAAVDVTEPVAGAVVPPLPTVAGEPVDTIRIAEAILAQIHSRYMAVRHDQTLAPPAERAYLEALERVQQAKERARKSGETEAQMRALIEQRVDAVHRRLPEHLAMELFHSRREIVMAIADEGTFLTWCRNFYAVVGERLASVNFNPALSQ